jgi:signal transduction histidine kinase
VKSLIESPVLVDATGLLSAEFQKRLRSLARLAGPVCAELEAQFLQVLADRGAGAKQSKALAAITVAAALRMVTRRKPLEDFIEQVAYSGRRLAKLDVEPASVVASLSAFDGLLTKILRHFPPADAAESRRLADQLNFCSILTLNNAFYQVRETETQAFFQLHAAELKAKNGRALVRAFLRILSRYARADAACARLPETGGAPPPAVLARLSAPLMLSAGRRNARLFLDPDWNGRYRTVWSIPLGEGVAQFAFAREYEWLPRELRLLTGTAARCQSLLEKLRLVEELALRERQVRELAVHMLDVEERERRRIGRELHDETGQILPYLRLRLEMMERAAPEAPAVVKEGLAEARELIDRTVLEIRRVLSDLSPAVLEQLGLAAAVRQLLNQVRQTHGLTVRLRAPRLLRVRKTAEVAAYRIIQECCNNVVRHSSASHLNISLTTADEWLKMRIEDDGVGFRVEEALARADSYGIAGMRERVALAGGRFDVWSRRGSGTRVSVEIPAPAPERALTAQRRPSRDDGCRASCTS